MTMQTVSKSERNAQALAAFGLGMGGMGLISALMRPGKAGASTPQDLTLIQQALAEIIAQGNLTQGKLEDVVAKIQELIDAFLTGQVNINIQIPQGTPEEPYQLYNSNIRLATPVGFPLSTPLVDFRTSSRLLFKIDSTLDQAVNLQVVGDIFETTSIRQVNINGPIALPAGTSATAGIDWGDWHPYVGIQITVPVAPLTGYLQIYRVRKNID